MALTIPSEVIVVEAVPILGSGKTDFSAEKMMAEEKRAEEKRAA
jgi:hypothetical protein